MAWIKQERCKTPLPHKERVSNVSKLACVPLKPFSGAQAELPSAASGEGLLKLLASCFQEWDGAGAFPRPLELTYLRNKLSAASPGRILLLTGPPASGKSALLAQVLLCAQPPAVSSISS